MPSRVPDFTGDPSRDLLSARYLDHTGDLRSDALTGLNNAALTDAALNTFTAAMGACTQADFYGVAKIEEYAVVADKTDADAGDRSEVINNIVVLAKNAAGDSRRLFVPAPVPACLIEDSDDIDPASVVLGALFTAWLAILPAGFSITQARYTSRKQHNSATKI